MNLKGGESNYSNADLKIDLKLVGAYERAIEELSRKYYQDIENALKASLTNLMVDINSLKKGDIKQIILPNCDYSEFYFGPTLLFRLHSRPNLVKFGGWYIEYFGKT